VDGDDEGFGGGAVGEMHGADPERAAVLAADGKAVVAVDEHAVPGQQRLTAPLCQ
jgi:hypothetical protein